MPELPEVETVARELRRVVKAKEITDVWLSGFSLRRPIPQELPGRLRGRTVRRVMRRGKYILLELDPPLFWLVHLGMSGTLTFYPSRAPRADHTHAAVRFGDESELHYRDPRRFGLFLTRAASRPNRIPEIEHLGPDPMSRSFTPERLQSLLRASRQAIKSFLLNQHKIAGIGNIYACEALFHARVHPQRRCDSIKLHETRRLVRSIRKILRNAIRHRGTTISDFQDMMGDEGSHQTHLYVYQREGKRCRRCPESVTRLWQGNRSTFLCSNCQPAL